MLCGGDEYGRTQGGNNNAYCQDNEISWFKWDRTQQEEALQQYTSQLIALRRDHPSFRRPKFFHGRQVRGAGIKDIMWLNPSGNEMADEEWGTHFVKTLGVLLCGDALDVRDWHGKIVKDESFLMLLNASDVTIDFTLPRLRDLAWKVVIDTMDERGFPKDGASYPADGVVKLEGRTFTLLKEAR